jgi:hypothetical protein
MHQKNAELIKEEGLPWHVTTTLLHAAIFRCDDSQGDDALIDYIINSSSSEELEFSDGEGRTPLQAAIEVDNDDLIMKLYDCCDSLDASNFSSIETSKLRDLTGDKVYNDEEEEMRKAQKTRNRFKQIVGKMHHSSCLTEKEKLSSDWDNAEEANSEVDDLGSDEEEEREEALRDGIDPNDFAEKIKAKAMDNACNAYGGDEQEEGSTSSDDSDSDGQDSAFSDDDEEENNESVGEDDSADQKDSNSKGKEKDARLSETRNPNSFWGKNGSRTTQSSGDDQSRLSSDSKLSDDESNDDISFNNR